MRESYQVQGVLLVRPATTSRAREYERISQLLDEQPIVAELARQDLLRGGVSPDCGRGGLSADQTVRAHILKQSTGLSYRDLAEAIADSVTYQRFMRLGLGDKLPGKSTLQDNVSCIRAETLEAINRVVVKVGCELGVESGRKVRGDCTVVESNIHHPMDNTLLLDTVRVLVTRMEKAAKAGYRFGFTNHLRGAKRRSLAILNCRGKEKRRKHYVQLLQLTRGTLRSAEAAVQALEQAEVEFGLSPGDERLADELAHFIALGERVVDQTERRVIGGESVPAAEKVVSIFEPHTDIIRKDNRETYFGHKVYLTVGSSSLVLDCVVEDGNPADATMVERAITRVEEICGAVPEQAAFDGGFASKNNVKLAKELGVKQICFSKRRGIAVSDMVSSSWMYRRLRRFRAGIEGCISFLKRGFGLSRCTWRGEAHFKSYVWGSILASNLLVIARHSLKT